MSYWIRELAGWFLVICGLLVFLNVFFLLNRQVPGFLQTGPLVVMGIVVFRGGIHLLKVAVAARVCQKAMETPKSVRKR